MSYYSEVMTDGPAVYLRLDDVVLGGGPYGNAVANDASGNGRHGVIYNVTAYPSYVNPVTNSIPRAVANLGQVPLVDSGYSVELGNNGDSGGYILLPTLPLSNDYTFEMVMQGVTPGFFITFGRKNYPPEGGMDDRVFGGWFGSSISNGGTGNIEVSTYSHPPETFTNTTGSFYGINPLGSTVPTGVKFHLAVVRSGLGRTDVPGTPGESQFAVYVNGNLVAGAVSPGGYTYINPALDKYDLWRPGALPGSASETEPLRIGGTGCYVDEVAYYDKALSQSRLQAHAAQMGTQIRSTTGISLRTWTATNTSLTVPAKIYMATGGSSFTRMTASNTQLVVPTVIQGDANLTGFTTGYIASPVGTVPETTWDEYGNPNTASTGFDPNLASVDGYNIDARSKVVASFSISRMSVMGIMDTEASEPQVRTLGKALENSHVTGVRWRQGTLIDACNDVVQDYEHSSEGVWYGQLYNYQRGAITVNSGAVQITYQDWMSDYLFRRIGEIDTSVEGWIAIDWRVIRDDPANVGKWCKLDFISTSGAQFYIDQQQPRSAATDLLTGAPLPGWERSWFQIPAGYISEPGFELRGYGFYDEDKIEITAVLRAESPTETRFRPKLVLKRPPEQLNNIQTNVYRAWPYARDLDWYYAGSQEWARKLVPKQVQVLIKATDSASAKVVTPSFNRFLTLGRATQVTTAGKLHPPPVIRKASEAEVALPLRPIFAAMTLGRASEIDQTFAFDKLDATIAIPTVAPMLSAFVMTEDQSPVLTLITEPSVIEQAPATMRLTILGGLPIGLVTVTFQDQIIAQGTTDSDGNLYQLPVLISGDVAAAGSHTLVVTQSGTGAVASAETVISVIAGTAPLPVAPSPDAPPTLVAQPPATVRKWVLQDPAPGGLGSYVLPVNPRNMTSPHHEHSMTSRHTTSRSGRFHIFQAAMLPKEWQFGGYCPTQEMAEKLWQFREANRRIYVIDHHGRAWKVAITNLDITPRLRHWYNGEMSDWGSDWTMTVTVLDQDPVLVP